MHQLITGIDHCEFMASSSLSKVIPRIFVSRAWHWMGFKWVSCEYNGLLGPSRSASHHIPSGAAVGVGENIFLPSHLFSGYALRISQSDTPFTTRTVVGSLLPL